MPPLPFKRISQSGPSDASRTVRRLVQPSDSIRREIRRNLARISVAVASNWAFTPSSRSP
jgi:hypothetical protein